MNEQQQARGERIEAARRRLRQAMGRLVAGQAVHGAATEEDASAPRGDEGPEAVGAGEDGAAMEGRGTPAGQSRSAGQ